MNHDPPAGRLLAGRYRLQGQIARGGMATVHRARDERLQRDVAVKVLRPPYADDPGFADQFLAEARAAASITHPSLVHVYDSGTDEGLQYIVMELLDQHRSLRQVLDECGRLGVAETVELGRQLLAGLQAVHDRGLVHCDVKAANVMLGPGPAKLIDFGIARTPDAAPSGDTSMGSLHAMSPEQLRGEALSPASDIFAVGAVLYQALTGQVPYPGAKPGDVADAHAAGHVRPPSTLAPGVPPGLDEAILRSLRPDPGDRYARASDMALVLEGAIAQHDEDETTVIAAQTPQSAPGYVPPAVPTTAADAPPRRTRAPDRRPPDRRTAWRVVGSAALLAATALVIAFVVVPLLQLAREPGSGSPPPTATPTAGVGDRVTVPNTIGLLKVDAIAAANAAGLEWTIQCAQDASRPEGMIDQEPPAGTEVRRGSRFTMYSARIADCR